MLEARVRKLVEEQRAREERQIARDLARLPRDLQAEVIARADPLAPPELAGKPARVQRLYQNPPSGGTAVYRGLVVDGKLVIDHFPEWPYVGRRDAL